MKQPSFRDYETLQEYAKAIASYNDYQEKERTRKRKEQEKMDLDQAEKDFKDQYPEVIPMLEKSGFHYEFSKMNNGLMYVYLYEPKSNQSFAHLEMKYFVEIYADGNVESVYKWMLLNFDSSEDVIEYIMDESHLLKSYSELPF